MGNERGFTLIEIVVAAAIGAMLLWGMLVLANRTAASAEALDARLYASAGVSHLLERMTSEAASALAVYVPPTDVLGESNSDGHEVDFYAQDASHRSYAWSYTYDAAAKALTRYAFAPGVAPVAGERIASIDAFVASSVAASAISDSQNPAYDPLFASASARDVAYAIPSYPAAIGGNRLVALQIAASGVDTRALLASADAPTAFTVVIAYTPSPAPIATPTPAPQTLTP